MIWLSDLLRHEVGYDESMTDENALLSTIAAYPDDDAPRLVYADWLEEHDRPVRAEFIRIQCEIAQKQRSLPRNQLDQYVDLFKRNQELEDNHRQELLGPLAALPQDSQIVFHRGFVESVSLHVEEFLNLSATIAATIPMPSVGVTGIAQHFMRFLQNPYLHCVSRISGYSNEFDLLLEPDVEASVLWDQLLLNAANNLTRLESLDLEGCGIHDLHCDFAYNLSLPALVDLDLSSNQITDQGVSDLLRTSFPGQLRTLILGDNPITDTGAIELANNWPQESRLKNLNLRMTEIRHAGRLALLNRFSGIVDLF